MTRQHPPHRPTAVVMVGLPARGKTYTARKMARYLRWLGYEAQVFNVGNKRRDEVGAQQPHSFFDPDNPEGLAARWQMARATMADLLAWFEGGGDVGFYDATNTTRRRRQWAFDTLSDAGLDVVFVESICEDPTVIEANIRETKVASPDYAGMDPDAAVADFRARIAHYEGAYEPLSEAEGVPFIKLFDVNRKVTTFRLRGYLPGRIVALLMNLHLVPRPVWLVRHGQSAYNLQGRIGGDPDLSEAGREFARSLATFVDEHLGDRSLQVWTSTLHRTIQTAAPLGRPALAWRALDEIGSGTCDGLTYAEFAERFPADMAARQRDKLRYRYPRGESYEDVMARLEPVILELERQRELVLVVGHQAVLRALYGYLTNVAPEDIPHLSIPLHTVIELTPRAYGASERRFPLAPQVGDAGSS